jgi:hypothetical protein
VTLVDLNNSFTHSAVWRSWKAIDSYSGKYLVWILAGTWGLSQTTAGIVPRWSHGRSLPIPHSSFISPFDAVQSSFRGRREVPSPTPTNFITRFPFLFFFINNE